MLTELCQEIRNWFELERHFGVFKIEGGQLADVSFLKDGQYFRIIGSVFNDGVHQYGSDNSDPLTDEEFKGAIWAMAVPPTVIALSEEIEAWVALYGGATSHAKSPYQSESFGGYSYSKGGGGGGNGSSSAAAGVPTWKAVFADELHRWRKI